MAKKENYEYNPKRRRLAKLYSKQKLIMSLGNDLIIPIMVILTLFELGYFEKIANWALSFGNIAGSFIFIFIFAIMMSIVEFPLELYATYFYEHKYKLSKQNIGDWFVDFFKNTLIGYIIVIPIGGITALLAMHSKLWWLYAGLISISVSILLNFIYPIIILPFLYKLKPYKDKNELKILLDIFKRAGTSNIKTVKILKESEKSTKSNAFFAGFGKTKMIVLYDNLLNAFTKREIRTIIGHEAGHYVNKDLAKSIIAESAQTIFDLFLINLIIKALFFETVSGIPLRLYPIISALTIIIGLILMPPLMIYSRKLETAADTFALDEIKDPLAQISSEKRLADVDLSDNKPNPFVEFWFYSHPSADKRIKNVKEWMKAQKD